VKQPAFLVLIFGAALFCGNMTYADTSGIVASVTGKVEISDADGDNWTQSVVGSTLGVEQRLRTGDKSSASLALLNGLALNVKEQAEIRVLAIKPAVAEGAKAEALVELLQGRMVVLISPEYEDLITFRVKTPQGIAQPRGIFYAIQVLGDRAFLAVREGKVGLDQFSPLEQSDISAEEETADEPAPVFGRTTTSSPRG
jgi:hypothetical protein